MKPGEIQTAVAVILAPGSRGLDALFIRRAERAGDPWSGHVALPGGRREPRDADLLATAVRETAEEVGVALDPAAALGTLEDLCPRAPSLPPLRVRPYVFALRRRPKTRLSDEVAGVMWLSLSELSAREGSAVVSSRGVERAVPCLRSGETVVWGLTYRILQQLLPLL